TLAMQSIHLANTDVLTCAKISASIPPQPPSCSPARQSFTKTFSLSVAASPKLFPALLETFVHTMFTPENCAGAFTRFRTKANSERTHGPKTPGRKSDPPTIGLECHWIQRPAFSSSLPDPQLSISTAAIASVT